MLDSGVRGVTAEEHPPGSSRQTARVGVKGIVVVIEEYLSRAVKLAHEGRGWVTPNPPVGAIAVRDGEVLAQGFHRRYGGPHAEAALFAEARQRGIHERLRGADLYVTLEPCAHHGKTPPCSDAIISHGIRRVFYAVDDPNPETAGLGPRQMRAAGIEVRQFEHAEALWQLAPYLSVRRRQRPLVTAKWAMTLDGRIATRDRDSKWVSSETTRAHTRAERGDYDAILIGRGTAQADDPRLTCDAEKRKNPLRIVLDSQLQLRLDSQLLTSLDHAPLLLLATAPTSAASSTEPAAGWRERRDKLLGLGAQIEEIPASSAGGIDLGDALMRLTRVHRVAHLLVEGGGRVHGSFFDAALVDRVQCIVAPKIVGGEGAPAPIGGVGCATMAGAQPLSHWQWQDLDGDWVGHGAVTAAGLGLAPSRE